MATARLLPLTAATAPPIPRPRCPRQRQPESRGPRRTARLLPRGAGRPGAPLRNWVSPDVWGCQQKSGSGSGRNLGVSPRRRRGRAAPRSPRCPAPEGRRLRSRGGPHRPHPISGGLGECGLGRPGVGRGWARRGAGCNTIHFYFDIGSEALRTLKECGPPPALLSPQSWGRRRRVGQQPRAARRCPRCPHRPHLSAARTELDFPRPGLGCLRTRGPCPTTMTSST